ncbi:MAG: pantetheine-phosphate adenylyltransferase [Spirochaetaceae bacterium]|nr:pantetheine-phosphate adenylyltransferase [Spirochaetaceae bacterium]
MGIAVFAGSFDPPSLGHLDIIKRASRIFSHLHIVIAINSEKKSFFTPEERKTMMQEIVKDISNVTVVTYSSLIVEYARKVGADTLVRGIRNVDDFSYEFDLALLNKGLEKNIETVFLPTSPRYFVIRSSAIKELAKYNGDLSSMVPDIVATALKEKRAQQTKT